MAEKSSEGGSKQQEGYSYFIDKNREMSLGAENGTWW